jgi:hypothetical protein
MAGQKVVKEGEFWLNLRVFGMVWTGFKAGRGGLGDLSFADQAARWCSQGISLRPDHSP